MKERIVEFTPAWDWRSPEPEKNYGIHGVELRMVLKGPEGAVQFVVYTNWQLNHVKDEFVKKMLRTREDMTCLLLPMPADVGYHSPKPTYEGQQPMDGTPCPYLDGKPCYYDGSGLRAEGVFQIMLTEGSDGVWKFLEKYYDELFVEKEKS